MAEINIREVNEIDDTIGSFIRNEFSWYGKQHGIILDYSEFCFVAENRDESLAGVITGKAYYNEVHIQDLVVNKDCRGNGIGSRLVETVEDHYRNKGFRFVTLTTFEFQAPEFYKKLGYTVEFIRKTDNQLLNKYFFRKDL